MINDTKLYYSADLETTQLQYDENGIPYTKCWSSGLVPLDLTGNNAELPTIRFETIEQTFWYIEKQLKVCDVVMFYHNLSFDGSFWLDYLHFGNKYMKSSFDEDTQTFPEPWKMRNWRYSYLISRMGQWYNIKFKIHGHYCTIYDSLKLLPFKLAVIGDSFNLAHKKLHMSYNGHTDIGQQITEQEKAYIDNDLYVLKDALEYCFITEGLTKTTIGSNCLAEYKKNVAPTKEEWQALFPNLKAIDLNFKHTEKYKDLFLQGEVNADDFIRKSYRGGYCYVKEDRAKTVIYNGLTADVNSLYPSQMRSEGGRFYPIGKPNWFTGSPFALGYNLNSDCSEVWGVVRLKCRFELKENYLPFIQIRDKKTLYKKNEMLKTSDIYDKKTGKYLRYYKDENGDLVEARPTLTLTFTDLILFLEHYNVFDLEYLGGCYFESRKGLFDDYINKYREIKTHSKGAKRQLAKLFSNNLYGQFAKSDDSSFKVIREDSENGILSYKDITEHEKDTVYIAVGTAVTSFARDFTIRTAQNNYDVFCYADTDSIHCNCTVGELKGVKIDSKEYNSWAIESIWSKGFFTRQKTYIEDCSIIDGEKVKKSNYKERYNIKCAGLTPRVKRKIAKKLYKGSMELTDFIEGFETNGKLAKKTVKGGVVLYKTTFSIR